LDFHLEQVIPWWLWSDCTNRKQTQLPLPSNKLGNKDDRVREKRKKKENVTSPAPPPQ
jgi:hypothetical protein